MVGHVNLEEQVDVDFSRARRSGALRRKPAHEPCEAWLSQRWEGFDLPTFSDEAVLGTSLFRAARR